MSSPNPCGLLARGNSLAIERMREKDDEERLERLNTKQKAGTPLRDVGLQHKVLYWIIELIGQKPKGKMDYDHWIQDGVVLGKILHCCMYNSVPMDMIEGPISKVQKREEMLDVFIKYARKFGVPETYIFDPETDLFQMKNIPKVTRCLAMLGKMANMKDFEDVTIEIPIEDPFTNNDDSDFGDE